MCVLDKAFGKCQLDAFDYVALFFYIFADFLAVILIARSVVLKFSSYHFGFVYFFFHLYPFLLHVF